VSIASATPDLCDLADEVARNHAGAKLTKFAEQLGLSASTVRAFILP